MIRWLNELSQQFLDKDYLLPGQTVEQRIDIIVNRAEEILQKPGFAQAFKENLYKGWYSLSTPIWTNFGTNRGLPISCVTGDTWINTLEKGGKQAKDIVLGDMVLTHKGRYRKVTNIIKTPQKSNIFQLKIGTRMTNLYLTGDHKVLTNLGWVETQDLNPKEHLVAVNREVELPETPYSIDLTEHTPYDFVIKDNKICKTASENTRIDRRKEIVSYYTMPYSNVELDEELAWALGLWFAEGSISTNKDKVPNGIRITTNLDDEKELANKWLDIITNKFNVNGNSYESFIERNGKINKWYNINVNSIIIGKLFSSFGAGCKDKTIPEWIVNLPNNILSQFLEGVLVGDGTTTKSGARKITLANPKLILQLYQIGLKLNLDMSLQMQEKAGKLSTTKYVYTLLFRSNVLSRNRHSGLSSIPFKDGLNYCPIREICKTNKKEDVYDFTVEEDHSFSAAGVILHNCFGSYIEDTTESILDTLAEVGMMTKHGGGTSAYFGELRPRGSTIKDNGQSDGSVHFMKLYDTLITTINQGRTRRGNFAAYLPIDHPDIEEFLGIRSEGHQIQDLSFGVSITDEWMKDMILGNHDKRRIWAKVLESRANTGFPYIFFYDNVNNNAPDAYRDQNRKIYASNLCTEIMNSSSKDESFVCDLSSMNVLYFDEWKDTNAVELLVYFLDAVMTEFIEKASKISLMKRAVKFAENQRALGIGWIGWHSCLQSKMIPFESREAQLLNMDIAATIQKQALFASQKMAKEYGEPALLQGYGRRNITLLAIAPTKSSSFILGQVSEGIEPHRTNYYIKDLQKGKFTIKNPYLVDLLESKGYNTDEVWLSILKNGGSVQFLDCLSESEKNVFKTFAEISPKEIIIQAAQRQKYIDQGQSLNLMIHPSIPIKDVNKLMIMAWELGIKSLYYQISVNAAQEFSRNILNCASCEA